MNIKNIYVTTVFFPEEYGTTYDTGFSILILSKKDKNKYCDLETGNNYLPYKSFGYTRVVEAVPLKNYYFSSGIRKINKYSDKKEVYKLVKKVKKLGKLN